MYFFQICLEMLVSYGQGITVTAPYYENDTLVVISAVDLLLDFISNFLSQQKLGKSGMAFVVDSSGFLVATSKGNATSTSSSGVQTRVAVLESKNEKIRRPSEKLIEQFGNFNIELSDGTIHRFSVHINGEAQLCTVTRLSDELGIDWSIVIVIPQDDWFEKIDQSNVLSAILGAIGNDLIFVFLYNDIVLL